MKFSMSKIKTQFVIDAHGKKRQVIMSVQDFEKILERLEYLLIKLDPGLRRGDISDWRKIFGASIDMHNKTKLSSRRRPGSRANGAGLLA